MRALPSSGHPSRRSFFDVSHTLNSLRGAKCCSLGLVDQHVQLAAVLNSRSKGLD